MNIHKIKPFRTGVYDQNPEKDFLAKHIGNGTVIGAYLSRPSAHYMYHAYHIEMDDGTKTTVLARNCGKIKEA